MREDSKIRGLTTLSIINLFGAEPPDSPATPGASGHPAFILNPYSVKVPIDTDVRKKIFTWILHGVIDHDLI